MTGTIDHLAAVFGDQAGWVFLGFGTGQYITDTGRVDHKNWREESRAWPREADQILERITQAAVSGADVYYTPTLSENAVREKPKNPKHGRKRLPVTTLFSDLDDGYDAGRVDQLIEGGAYTVKSGSGPERRHLYVPLVEPASPDVAEDLLRRLAAWVGADRAPTWHGAYLRPVGGLNWKPTTLTGETPGKVEFCTPPCEPAWTVDMLDDLLPEVAYTAAAGDIPDAEKLEDADLPDVVAQILAEQPNGDRSKQSITAVRALKEAGLSDGQALTVMRQHKPTVEKYGDRVDAEVTRSLGKVNTSLAEREDYAWAGVDQSDNGHKPAGKPRRIIGALDDGSRMTDVGNARRLVDIASGRLRYVHAWGKWLVYQDGRWTIDENDALVTEQAKQVAPELFRQAAAIRDDKDKRKELWKFAVRSESSAGIAAMIRLARGIPGVLVEHEQLDVDPYLLNVRNGTIDLRTGTLRAANPADLITVQCPVDYDPDATAPLWEACVERWQPDTTIRNYIQTRAGAGATGIPTETVDVDYGGGGNGKSKFHGAIQHVLGDYAVVPHKSLLVVQRHEQHETVVAQMFRKRLALASETRAADVLDDEQVKNLTGGDRLRGRRMREDPWEFQPSHTLIMFSNHKPTVQGRDEGIWRRLRLVPWEVTIPDDERDTDLATKLRAEAPGILAWIVAGARRFIAEGLTPPAAVRAATDNYRTDEDVIGRFIRDVLLIGDGWAMSADIKAELEAWADEQGVTPPRMNEIAETLRGLGCRDSGRRMINGRRSTMWSGVSVAEVRPVAP